MDIKKFMRSAVDRLPHGGISDRVYLFLVFAYAHGRIPRRNSGLFNDYLYFLKTSPEILDIVRQMTSDKIMVKDFVEKVCGDGLTLETSKVFQSIGEINADDLPKPCVIKPAHSSGSVVFIEDGPDPLKWQDKEILSDAIETSPYIKSREANYRYLRRRLICEPMMPEGVATKDYKFFCYRGEPRLVQVDSQRHSLHRRNIYKSDWTPLDLEYNFPVGEWESAPRCLGKMLDIAKKLSERFEFVRVDFFMCGEKVFVGELTHCPESAHGRFPTVEAERWFSEILFGRS